MNRKKLLKRIIMLILLISIINLLSMQFHWYSSIWWIDMFLHAFGGLFIGLLFFAIFPLKELNTKSIIYVLATVLLVGIFWEFFEIIFVNYVAGDIFNILDTLSDLFFDLAGGSLAIFYFFKRIMVHKDIVV